VPDPRRFRFQWFAAQFEALADDLNASKDVDKRKELLRRMKVILDRVDQLIFRERPFDSKQDKDADAREE